MRRFHRNAASVHIHFSSGGDNFTTYIKRDDWILGHNIFFHVNKFFGLAPSENASLSLHDGSNFSQHSFVTTLPVSDAAAFIANVRMGWVSGTTLLVDFPFSSFPNHLGYWTELLAPIYSQLSLGEIDVAAATDSPVVDHPAVTTVLIPNLRRSSVLSVPWVVELFQVALHPSLPKGGAPPRLMFWDDLEETPLGDWLAFERVLHIYSRHDHPVKGRGIGFASQELAERFRIAVHEAAGVPAGVSSSVTSPRLMTYLILESGETVANNDEVLQALHEIAASSKQEKLVVRPYSTTTGAPLTSILSIMSLTGILVGRHGPLLANSIFLPKGAAVVEILPFNWDFGGLSEVYYNLTGSIGGIGHVAWRASSAEHMRYESESNARYSNWTAEECSSTTCLDAQSNSAIYVDIVKLQAVVADAVTSVLQGTNGDDLRARHPLPKRAELSGKTGLWWDRS